MYSFKLKLLLSFFLLAWLIMNLACYFQDYMCIQAVSFWGNALFFWLSNHIKDLLSNTSYLITAFTMTFFLINLINNNNNNANWCHCKTSCCWIIKDTGRNFKTTFKKSSIDFGMNNMYNMISFPPSSYPCFYIDTCRRFSIERLDTRTHTKILESGCQTKGLFRKLIYFGIYRHKRQIWRNC